MKNLRVAVVGATGVVGRAVLDILDQRKFPVDELVPFASERSRGKKIPFANKDWDCQVMEKGCFNGIDIAFFDLPDDISRKWIPQAAEEGAWVIDNSAAFRMDEDKWIVVPEVNGEEFKKHLRSGKASRIITGPNCSVAQMVVALKPISDGWGLKRVVASTYQSTSGGGLAAMNELTDQTRGVLDGKPAQPKNFPHQIAFNCIPQIGGFRENGFTSEEEK